MNYKKWILFLTLIIPANQCFAGDGATLIFKSGQVVFLDNGYKTLSTGLLKLGQNQSSRMELTLEGSSFVIDLSEINILCRDRCTNMVVVDQRDPARTTQEKPKR